MNRWLGACVIGGLVLVLLNPSVLCAQAVKGELLGNITDQAGLAVPGATVTITEVNTNISYNAVTNESGYYIFSNLKDGTYKVEAELTGFKKVIRDRVVVPVNVTVRVDLKMEVGAIEESITVVGETPVLQTDRADTGRVIESIQVQELPLGQNRNFQGMLITVPGATRPHRPHSEFFNPQDSLSTEVNGQSRLASGVQLEGIDDTQKTGLLTVLIPSADAIETVNVTTSNYDAEFGRAGGAISNVTLKSGTNDFKGSVYAFGNNEKTNAPGYFSHQNPPGDYLESGFTLGGPIQRNKLFFFGDYRHIVDHSGRTTRAAIPDAAFRSGDLSASSTKIYDPATGNPDGTGRLAFPGNNINQTYNPATGTWSPANRISPIAKGILATVPSPNIPGNIGQINYQQNYVRSKLTNSFDTKVNVQLSENDQLSGRLSYLRPDITDPPTFGFVGGIKDFAGTGTDTTYSTGVNYTRTWSSTLVMEARGGVSYYHNQALSAGNGLKTAQDLGIRNVNLDDWSSGMTSIDIQPSWSSPLVGFSASLPWDRSERTAEVVSVFTKLKGNHTIKFGEDFRHNRDFLLQTQDNGGPRGQFQFRASQTALPSDSASTNGFANAFASFLLDVPSRVARDLKVTLPGTRHWAFFTFVQDKWEVSPRLTLDLGLRHEFYTPLVGLVDQGGLSNYDPATNTLQVTGYGSVPQNAGVQQYWKNFAPRTGASFRLNDKTVVRGGYGVSTIPFPDNSYIYNFPVKQNNQFNPPNTFAVAGSMAAGFPAPIVAQIPQNGIIDAGTPALRNAGYFHVRPDLHEARLHSWNVAFQRQLPANFALDLAYVGNRGQDLLFQFNENAGMVLGADNAGRPLFQAFGKSADVTTYIPLKSSYNALQAKLDRRFSNGLLVTTSYTLGRSKNYTQGDDNGGIPTPADIERSYARSGVDRLQTFVTSFVYQLPVGPNGRYLREGPLSQVIGGWQVSGFFDAYSGTPINFTANNATLKAPGNTQRPNASGTPKVLGGIGPGNLWFDTSVFSAPAPATWGNVQRDALLDGPNYVNLDLVLAKLFVLPHGIKGEFRADMFNVLNTPHFDNPSGDFSSANFGQITGAGGARSMRFGIRIQF